MNMSLHHSGFINVFFSRNLCRYDIYVRLFLKQNTFPQWFITILKVDEHLSNYGWSLSNNTEIGWRGKKTDRMMSFCIARILIRTVIQQSNNENVHLRDHISKAQDGFLLGHNFLIMVRFTLLFTPLVYGI